jgi:DNA helicase II / ATP-dependent DNA helicase PcrA
MKTSKPIVVFILMDLLIQKQDYLTLLKNDLYIQQKKILEIEMNIMTVEKDIVDIIDSNNSNQMFDNMSLSIKQQEIVDSISPNILVVACPGSGKTHTVIARYINLVVKQKVDPNSIILITFTKKAGMEMNNRIQAFVPNKNPYYVGSLHGLGYRLLQEFNVSPNGINNTVLNETEYKYLIKECATKVLAESILSIEEQNMIKMQIPYIYDKISTEYPLNINDTLKLLSISNKYKKLVNDILKNYKTIKKEQHLVDFNDLMIQFCQLLGTKKINTFLEGIKYVFFDEYQDINPVQNYILKCFSNHSNIMVVGDDAQAIYAFRGSSIKYIWDFEKNYNNVTTYYLETNYRSTPSIVDFSQEIISHNTTQFNKNVKSFQDTIGLKPHIKCHNSSIKQYEWIVSDIIEKRKQGVLLKDMVVLSRTNQSINKIEIELMKHSIPIIKSIGISLLNKNHIKDLIAFLIITINTKSTIHWKRILASHKDIGLIKAHSLIESWSQCKNTPFDGMEMLCKMNENGDNTFNNLYTLLQSVKTLKPKETVHMIIQYLIILWKDNRERNIENKITDMNNLIIYLGNDIIETFISNLNLNIDIISTEDSLFLSTVHSAKGLEWDHVYIMDMNNNDFPSLKHSFYKNELMICEEERRLFYVAASRAKKYLTITTHHEKYVTISPFIKELNPITYLHSNFSNVLQFTYNFTGYILKDIKNYLNYNGYEKIINMLNSITHTRNNIFNNINILPAPTNLTDRYIAGNMMNTLIVKMIQINFPNIIKGFNCSQTTIDKIPQSIYCNYIDKLTDWRNILSDIFHIATYKHYNSSIVEQWKSYLLGDEMKSFYNNLEKMLINYIKNLKPVTINVNMNINSKVIYGIADILITTRESTYLIDIKTSPDEICTVPNLYQTIMYGYLLKKKQIDISNIILLNVWDGMIDSFDMKEFSTLLYFNKFKKILYNIN